MNCNLGQKAHVGKHAIVGNGCRLSNSVSVFSRVELDDFVFCTPFMVFAHVSFPCVAVNRRSNFRDTIVKTVASLGANCTIVPGITIGKGTFAAGRATLATGCNDWAPMVSTPAREIGWMSP